MSRVPGTADFRTTTLNPLYQAYAAKLMQNECGSAKRKTLQHYTSCVLPGMPVVKVQSLHIRTR